RHVDDRAEHRRWVAPRLQEQGVGNDGADGCKGQRARDHVLRTMQQDTHRQAALAVGIDRYRFGATAAARHVVVSGNLSRHFSSPGELGLYEPDFGFPTATAE